jgi:CheY-like chemotaxis protein
MRKKVLWIEDSAFNEITILAAPVHLSGDYQLEFAFSATEAVEQLQRQEFDAVVVDIRIPPGNDDLWIDVYYKAGASTKASRLGLKLLQFVLGKESDWNRSLPLPARDRSRYGVLSMESWNDLKEDLAGVGIACYRDKGSGDDPDVLLQIIRDILDHQTVRSA